MKTKKTIEKYLVWIGLVICTLSACNKGNENFLNKEQFFSANISGFSASSETLVAKLSGSTTIEQEMLGGGSLAAFFTYPLRDTDNVIKLTITEKLSGKVVLERELKKEEYTAKINFFYKDGRITLMPNLPAVEEDKIKLIYMFMPKVTNYTEAVDIVVGKYYLTPKVFEEITRAKNVKAYEFCQPISLSTFSTLPQIYNGVTTTVSFQVRIYKAGTNIPYGDGTGYNLSQTATILQRPAASTPSSKLYICQEGLAGNTLNYTTRLEF